MKASTTLKVDDNMPAEVTLFMTVGEMRRLLELLSQEQRWPAASLRHVLHMSLLRATQAYDTPHQID